VKTVRRTIFTSFHTFYSYFIYYNFTPSSFFTNRLLESNTI